MLKAYDLSEGCYKTVIGRIRAIYRLLDLKVKITVQYYKENIKPKILRLI